MNRLVSFLLVLSALFLVACESEDVQGDAYIEESDLLVEDVEFKLLTSGFDALFLGDSSLDKVIISTSEEDFIIYLDELTFSKTDQEQSTITIQKKIKNENSVNRSDDLKGQIFLNKEDLRAISREYIDLYSRNLEIQ